MDTNEDNVVRLVPYGGDLGTIMRYMQANGGTVLLALGQNATQWDCSWVHGGQLTIARHPDPSEAARSCLREMAQRKRPTSGPGQVPTQPR